MAPIFEDSGAFYIRDERVLLHTTIDILVLRN